MESAYDRPAYGQLDKHNAPLMVAFPELTLHDIA
jgi:hypothetical protein